MFKINDESKHDIKCLSSLIFDWSKIDNINCAYSANCINSDECKEILSKPIDNRLFFVGEALVKSYPAIQNTMETTKEAVITIQKLSTFVGRNQSSSCQLI